MSPNYVTYTRMTRLVYFKYNPCNQLFDMYNNDEDSLYEISFAIKVAEEKLDQLGYYIYKISNKNNTPTDFESAIKIFKNALDNNEIELVDD